MQTLPLSQDDLALLLRLGLIEVTGRTADGKVTEYKLTHAGRTLGAPR